MQPLPSSANTVASLLYSFVILAWPRSSPTLLSLLWRFPWVGVGLGDL